MMKNILILLILPLTLMACTGNTLDLKIRYQQVEGLKQGDRVIFEQNQIGTVEKVFYSDEGVFIVSLAIKKDFANAATEHSQFFIITDPQNKENKAVEMIQTHKGGTPLQNNTVVEGSTQTSAIVKQVVGGIENGLKNLQRQFEQFTKDLKSIPQSDEFKKLEKELQRLAEEIKQSGEAARQKLHEVFLPKLKQEMEKLRKQLRKFGREDEMKPLETQMENIQKI